MTRVTRLLGSLALVFSISASAQAQQYTQKAVALLGDTAPGTGGGTYSEIQVPDINASGDVAFPAEVTGGSVGFGLFVDSGGVDTVVALAGDSAPGTGGGTFSYFDAASINASGDVAWQSLVTGGTATEGVFVDSGGTITSVALSGDTAPETGGGTYASFNSVSINASGDVAFTAAVTGGTAAYGVFVDSGGTDTALAVSGDTAPGTGGGTYSVLSDCAMNDSGNVMFDAQVTGGTGTDGVFLDSGGTDTAVGVAGDPAPGTGGGTYCSVACFNGGRSISASGGVAFSASVTGGTVTHGVFVDSGGTHSAVALPGEAAPGPLGGTYIIVGIPKISASGDVAFPAIVTGSAIAGIFVASGATDLGAAFIADTAPGTGGGTYSSFTLLWSIDSSGGVLFTADVAGGSVSGGLFRAARLTELPALGLFGRSAACLVLVASILLAKRHAAGKGQYRDPAQWDRLFHPTVGQGAAR